MSTACPMQYGNWKHALHKYELMLWWDGTMWSEYRRLHLRTWCTWPTKSMLSDGEISCDAKNMHHPRGLGGGGLTLITSPHPIRQPHTSTEQACWQIVWMIAIAWARWKKQSRPDNKGNGIRHCHLESRWILMFGRSQSPDDTQVLKVFVKIVESHYSVQIRFYLSYFTCVCGCLPCSFSN